MHFGRRVNGMVVNLKDAEYDRLMTWRFFRFPRYGRRGDLKNGETG